MKKSILLSLLAVFVGGCVDPVEQISITGNLLAGTYEYPDTPTIERKVDDFDNSLVMKLNYGKLIDAKGENITAVVMGARWDSNNKENMIIRLSFGGNTDYLNFNRFVVSLDGEKKSFEIRGRTRHESGDYSDGSIPTTSKAEFRMPIEYLKEMLAENDVRIRIYTSDGYINSYFHHAECPKYKGLYCITAKKSLLAFVSEVEVATAEL